MPNYNLFGLALAADFPITSIQHSSFQHLIELLQTGNYNSSSTHGTSCSSDTNQSWHLISQEVCLTLKTAHKKISPEEIKI